MHYKNCRMFSAEVKVPRRILADMYDSMECLFGTNARWFFGFNIITMIKRHNSLGDVVCKFAIRFDKAQAHPERMDEVVELLAKWTIAEVTAEYWNLESSHLGRISLQTLDGYKELLK